MKGLSVYAIVAGAAADMVGTLLVSIILTSVAGGLLLSQGVPEDEIGARLAADTRVLVWSVALGLVASLVGGLVAARIAKHREPTHGASAGAVGLVLSTLSAVVSPVSLPTWYVFAGYGLVVPIAALGGLLGKMWNDRHGKAPRT
jgi:putative membrane protein (TIGR04086 family)